MKLRSPISHKKARIEIIPLIDIMFFLLACFMLVSLSMVQMRGMKVDLPTAVATTPEKKSDFFAITLDANGRFYLEKEAVTEEQLLERAKALMLANPAARFYLRADQNATHGEVVRVLDRLHQAGLQKVSFELKAQAVSGPLPASSPEPVSAPAASAPVEPSGMPEAAAPAARVP